MLDEHWDACEADFQQFYGINLEEEWGSIGMRRLAVLLTNLPYDSRLSHIYGDGGESQTTSGGAKAVSIRELGGWLDKRGG